jgi:hypothetical protein
MNSIGLNDASPAGKLVLRDDQAEFAALLDAAKACRARRSRLHLFDSGRLTVSELEWLGRAGADLYSSDAARRSPAELLLLGAATGKGGGALSVYLHGPFADEAGPGRLPFAALREIAREGIHIYVSNKDVGRGLDRLVELADDAASGGSVLGYYHHGPAEPWLEELARRGAWIHLDSGVLGTDEGGRWTGDAARAATKAGAGLVLHVESAPSALRLADALDAGAFVVFRTPPSDYRSPLRALEKRAARRRVGRRAGYLYPEFMR